MKFLKYLLYVFIALLVIIFIASFFIAKKVTLDRSVIVDGTQAEVWEYTNDLQDMHEWSPFAKLDTNMTVEYIGEQGAVGSIYKWQGDPNLVGTGEQEIIEIDAPNTLKTELRFKVPSEGIGVANISLEPVEEGKTKMTWSFESESAWPMNLLNPIMKGVLGKQFEDGVRNFKVYVDSMQAIPKPVTSQYIIKEMEVESRIYVGHRQSVNMDKVSTFLGNNFEPIMDIIKSNNVKMLSRPSGIYFSWDMETQETDMAAAIAVSKVPREIGDLDIFELPASKVLTLDYYGSYEASMSAHKALEAYLTEHGLEFNTYAVEEYVTDPSTEPDPAQWLTKITYYLK